MHLAAAAVWSWLCLPCCIQKATLGDSPPHHQVIQPFHPCFPAGSGGDIDVFLVAEHWDRVRVVHPLGRQVKPHTNFWWVLKEDRALLSVGFACGQAEQCWTWQPWKTIFALRKRWWVSACFLGERGTSIRENCRLFFRAEQLWPTLPFSFLKIPVLATLVINTHDFQMSARKRMAHTCNPSFLEVKASGDREKNPGWAAQ